MIEVTVNVDLEPLKRFNTQLSSDLRGSTSGPIRAAMRQWGARYRAFVQERFASYSRGGGAWPPLKASTKRGRRKARRGAKGTRSFGILRDTGTLFNALTPVFSAKPGQLQKDIPFGVRVGYGGASRHPTAKASVHDLAVFHQTGAGVLQKREIIVQPDSRTVSLMAEDMDRAIGRMATRTGNT